MRQFKTDGVLFDLDGTLWDSGDGVVEGYNLTAERMGLGRTFTPDQMHSVMGLQSQAILDRLVPDLSPEQQIAFRNEVCRCECEILRTGRGSRLLPGVRELLETLRPLCPLFIVSNCMGGYIEAFLEAHGLASYFADYEHPGRTGLSKGENIRLVMERNGVRHGVYVGDAQVDLEGARFARIPFLWARYGFGSVTGYDAALDDPRELPSLLDFTHESPAVTG